jgi:hypothetical protein
MFKLSNGRRNSSCFNNTRKRLEIVRYVVFAGDENPRVFVGTLTQPQKCNTLFLSGDLARYSKPLSEKYKPLGRWLDIQRDNIRAYDEDPSSPKVSTEQRQRLLDLGVVADVLSVKWEEKFDLFQQYKGEFGDCKHLRNHALELERIVTKAV